MREPESTTQTMTVPEVRAQLDALVDRVSRRETRVVVAKSGVPMVAIVPAEDLARLDQLAQERAERFKVIDEVRQAFKDVPPEEIERETDRVLAQIREEDRRQATGDGR